MQFCITRLGLFFQIQFTNFKSNIHILFEDRTRARLWKFSRGGLGTMLLIGREDSLVLLAICVKWRGILFFALHERLCTCKKGTITFKCNLTLKLLLSCLKMGTIISILSNKLCMQLRRLLVTLLLSCD